MSAYPDMPGGEHARAEVLEAEKATENRRRLVLTPASTIRPRPVHWLWKDRIPAGELTLTPGRAGIGKSTVHAWLIAEVTRGSLPGIYEGRPRSCVIAASEDSWARTIVPRLIAARADLDRVYRIDVEVGDSEIGRLVLPADCSLLADLIQEYSIALVSLDPLLSLISSTIDSHRNAEVRTALEPLARLADDTTAALLGNAHFSKGGGGDPLSMVTGSAAFGEVARAALGFARDPDDGSFVMSQIKNNLGRLDLPSLGYVIEEQPVETGEGPARPGRIRWIGETDRCVADMLSGTRMTADERSDQDEAADWIAAFVGEHSGTGYAPAAEVLAAGTNAGFAKRTLQAARKRAGIRTTKAGMGGGWVWVLPDSEGATEGAEGAEGAEDAGSPEGGAFVDASVGAGAPHLAPSAPSAPSGEDPLWPDEPADTRTSHRLNMELPMCSVCITSPLLHPGSIEAGVCERCRLAAHREAA